MTVPTREDHGVVQIVEVISGVEAALFDLAG